MLKVNDVFKKITIGNNCKIVRVGRVVGVDTYKSLIFMAQKEDVRLEYVPGDEICKIEVNEGYRNKAVLIGSTCFDERIYRKIETSDIERVKTHCLSILDNEFGGGEIILAFYENFSDDEILKILDFACEIVGKIREGKIKANDDDGVIDKSVESTTYYDEFDDIEKSYTPIKIKGLEEYAIYGIEYIE